MKRLFPLIISLVIPLGMAAQRQTDKTVMDIANYLNEHCLEGAVTDAVCGHNRTKISFRYGVNSPRSINIVTEQASDVKPGDIIEELSSRFMSPHLRLCVECPLAGVSLRFTACLKICRPPSGL